jgi:hypothetical protein
MKKSTALRTMRKVRAKRMKTLTKKSRTAKTKRLSLNFLSSNEFSNCSIS